jgi:TRAP-type C4-dicarboxylate transport system permease small subunit
MKVVKWLDDHFEEAILVVFLVLIACVMMLQVIVRKIPFIPSLQWAEEFCRFMWIMSVFVSLPYTIRKSNMLRVSVVLDLMPHVVRKILNLIVDVIIVLCMGLLSYHSVGVVSKISASGELSPAMLWPMAIIYAVMLIGFILATLRGVQMFVIHIMHFNERELSTIEQTMADAAEEAAAGKKAEGGEN